VGIPAMKKGILGTLDPGTIKYRLGCANKVLQMHFNQNNKRKKYFRARRKGGIFFFYSYDMSGTTLGNDVDAQDSDDIRFYRLLITGLPLELGHKQRI
jgi:hypothetical protein